MIKADVCLILEGTYPYVSGGVSSWVYDIIRKMKDVTFSIVYLGAYSSKDRKQHYPIPENVIELREYFIFDYLPYTKNKGNLKENDYIVFEKFMTNFFEGTIEGFEDLLFIVRENKINIYDLMYSKKSWDFILDFYNKNLKDYPFSNFFWSWYIIWLPFFSLLKINLPEAGVYHSVSTGYAGLLATVAKIDKKKPFILTEHGIYTRERKIDILHSQWIYTKYQHKNKLNEKKDMIKELWIKFFYYLSNLSYEHSNEILSICEGNKNIQIEEGANKDKIRVIPNGVDLQSGIIEHRNNNKFKICFVGRVVPIKDINTFIRACSFVVKQIGHENIEIEILGPFDEDKEYYEKCKELISVEKLDTLIKFRGKVDLKEHYPKIDLVVLTSISEGQPLSILEAMSYGIPVVSTDVGDCKNLLLGNNWEEDQKIGISGIITPLRAPEKTGEAIVKLYQDKNFYDQLSKSARLRVEKFYQKNDMIGSYRYIYNKSILEESFL